MEEFEHQDEFWTRWEVVAARERAVDKALKFAEVSPQIFDIGDLLGCAVDIYNFMTGGIIDDEDTKQTVGTET